MLRSYTDACDAVHVVEIGLRLLGKTGGDPRARLLSYLADTLRMERQISSTVTKVETPEINERNPIWCSHLKPVLRSRTPRIVRFLALVKTVYVLL